MGVEQKIKHKQSELFVYINCRKENNNLQICLICPADYFYNVFYLLSISTILLVDLRSRGTDTLLLIVFRGRGEKELKGARK